MLSWLKVSSPGSCAHVRNPSLTAMTGSETLKKGQQHTPSLLSSISYFPVMCCGAAHLWTLLNGALLWPDSSLLLHFPSNLCSAFRLPPKRCQVFLFFLHGSTFASALPIFVHLFQYFFKIILWSVLFIKRLFSFGMRITCQISFLGSFANIFCLC